MGTGLSLVVPLVSHSGVTVRATRDRASREQGGEAGRVGEEATLGGPAAVGFEPVADGEAASSTVVTPGNGDVGQRRDAWPDAPGTCASA